MIRYRFCCPTCGGFDVFPPSGSTRYELWQVWGLYECGDCGAQTARLRCVEVMR